MDPYVYAIFIFVLLCGLLLLYRNYILLPKNKKQSGEAEQEQKDREARLFRLYQNMEEMMDNFEAYIEDTREQMDKVKDELKRQAEEVRDVIRRAEAAESSAKTAAAALKNMDKSAPEKKDTPAESSAESLPQPNRREAIRELITKGLTAEQAAQKLGLSINEVKLASYGLVKTTK